MEYSIIDSQMRHENREKLIEFANDMGYDFYTEMIYKMHHAGSSPAELENMLIDENGNPLVTKNCIYTMLRKNGWLIIRRTKTNIKKEENKNICSCCQRAYVHKSLKMLCMPCYKKGGSGSKGVNRGNCDPHAECGNGVSLHTGSIL